MFKILHTSFKRTYYSTNNQRSSCLTSCLHTEEYFDYPYYYWCDTALPLRKNEKPKMGQYKNQENPRSNFYTFPYDFFFKSGKTDFSRKRFFFSQQLIFKKCCPHFQIVTLFRPKLRAEFFEIRYFQQKNP